MARNRRMLVATVLLFGICRFVSAADATVQKDPHRPACTTARCEKIKNFLRQHYCGKPVGNGPDDSCDLRELKSPVSSTTITVDYECTWNDATSRCKQKKLPTPDVRRILLREMRQIGLPTNGEREVHYTVMESNSGWSLMMANYEHVAGSKVAICQVIAARRGHEFHLLRKLPLKTTDADVPEVTRWFPLDIADVDGDGSVEVVLEGDEYENHWLEVISLDDGSFQTVFSGLGYYL